MRTADALDEINAFRAGFRHGQDCGPTSPREAEIELRRLFEVEPTAVMIDMWGHGNDDGVRGDTFRYLLSFKTSGGLPLESEIT